MCVLLSVVWVLLLSFPSWPLQAQGSSFFVSTNFSDAATLKVKRGGKEIGRETFMIRWADGLLKAEADITLNQMPGENISLHTELAMDGSGKVVSYRASRTGSGSKKELQVTFENQVAICEEKTANSSESTPVIVEPGFMVLDTNVFHHFELLVQRLLAPAVPAGLPVLIPQEGVAGTLKIQPLGKESIKVGKSKVAVSHYKLDSGQVQLSLWFDDAGKLYKISVPKTKAEVTRVE